MYLWGSGGVGKSYNVIATLRELQADYKLYNSHMDGRALYNELERYPHSVHVLEDMEKILKLNSIQGLLRSAMWGQRREGDGRMERLLTWCTHSRRKALSCYFSGAIIVVANRAMSDLPELEAIKTRIVVYHLTASDAEIRAMMRAMARKGYTDETGLRLDPIECCEVCEFIVSECDGLHRALDLRLLINSYADYLQHQEGEAGCHWRDLVAARVREQSTPYRHPVTVAPSGQTLVAIAVRKEEQYSIVREIVAATTVPSEREQLWIERTAMSRSTFHRRKLELGLSD